MDINMLLTETAGGTDGGMGSVGLTYGISIVAMLVIFYFLMIRPQRKEQKKMQEMLQSWLLRQVQDKSPVRHDWIW